MGQVLTLLGLSVADPLRSAVAMLSIDVPALFIHFECHGIKHSSSYYAGWLVAAIFLRPQFGAAPAHHRWLSTRSCSRGTYGLEELLGVLDASKSGRYMYPRCRPSARRVKAQNVRGGRQHCALFGPSPQSLNANTARATGGSVP